MPRHGISRLAEIRRMGSSDLTQQLEKWGLASAGFDYNLVAVFGSQSTGKSA